MLQVCWHSRQLQGRMVRWQRDCSLSLFAVGSFGVCPPDMPSKKTKSTAGWLWTRPGTSALGKKKKVETMYILGFPQVGSQSRAPSFFPGSTPSGHGTQCLLFNQWCTDLISSFQTMSYVVWDVLLRSPGEGWCVRKIQVSPLLNWEVLVFVLKLILYVRLSLFY